MRKQSSEEIDKNLDFSEDEEWKICVDFTESYRQLLISQFWKLNDFENDASYNSSLFSEYKRRMYDLSTVDFHWLPPWDDTAQQNYRQASEGDFHTSLITAHASGDICIWNVCINYLAGQPDGSRNEPNLYLTLEFRRNLVQGEIVSSLSFYKISSTLGVLIVGTTRGVIKAFRISYNSATENSLKPLPPEERPLLQKYTVGDGLLLCDNDGIEVQTTCGVVVPENGVGRLLLFVFRHPNFMMPFELLVSPDENVGIIIEQVQPSLRIVQGILTGVLVVAQDKSAEGIMLMTLTQRGVLSWMDIQHGQVKQVSSLDLAYLEEVGTKEPNTGDGEGFGIAKKRLQFGGLAISPNEAMICVSKTLAEYYNHLALRTPSVLQFHSLFPNKTVWPFVYKKCVENDFLFHKMTDVLSAFRQIMSTSENILTEVLNWAVPLDTKSLQDLQILFWILRIQPKIDRDQLTFAYNLRNEQPQPYHDLKCKLVRAMRRETLVSDRIMQLRCWQLINRILETPEKYNLEGNVANLQSLMIMYDYLETKPKLQGIRGPLPLKPRVLVDPPPRKPACPLCEKPTKLLTAPLTDRWKAGEDFIVEHSIDEEGIDGVLWHEQTHVQKSRSHPITNCVLSLIPTAFPYRKCAFCGTICMLQPTFGEEPLCPFCNGMMDPPIGFYEEEEESLPQEGRSDNVELQRLISEVKAQQEEERKQRALSKPMSRRARIENMYIDT